MKKYECMDNALPFAVKNLAHLKHAQIRIKEIIMNSNFRIYRLYFQ